MILEISRDMARPLRIPCTEPAVCPSDEKLYVIHVIIEPGEGDQECWLFQQEAEQLKNCLMIDQLLSEGNRRQGKDKKENCMEKLLMLEFSSYCKNKVGEILLRNVEYNGSQYCFLGFSKSQLKKRNAFSSPKTI